MCPISVVASQRLNDQLPFDTGERVPDQTADTRAIKGRQLDQFWRAETVRRSAFAPPRMLECAPFPLSERARVWLIKS